MTAEQPKDQGPTNEQIQGELERYFNSLGLERLNKIRELANNDKHVVNEKLYVVRKVTVKQFQELEQMRAKLEMSKESKDRANAVQIMADLYKKMALYYLDIKEAEYFNCDWSEIKIILDACAFRTLYGKPFL